MDETAMTGRHDGHDPAVCRASQDALLAFAQLLARLVAGNLGGGAWAPEGGARRTRVGIEEPAARAE